MGFRPYIVVARSHWIAMINRDQFARATIKPPQSGADCLKRKTSASFARRGMIFIQQLVSNLAYPRENGASQLRHSAGFAPLIGGLPDFPNRPYFWELLVLVVKVKAL
jgi:hypothetical protein